MAGEREVHFGVLKIGNLEIERDVGGKVRARNIAWTSWYRPTCMIN
jgi:hypothetical protein